MLGIVCGELMLAARGVDWLVGGLGLDIFAIKRPNRHDRNARVVLMRVWFASLV